MRITLDHARANQRRAWTQPRFHAASDSSSAFSPAS